MKLLEYRAKQLMAEYDIPIPRGVVASRPEEIKSIDFPVAVKAQVLVGGRGKAGGIRFADNLVEARQKASEIIGMSIKGEKAFP